MELIIPELGAFFNNGVSTSFSIPSGAAVKIIADKAIKYMDVISDSLGLYQTVIAGRNGEVKFNKLTAPRHVLQGSGDCDWLAKGSSRFVASKTKVYEYELMAEHCNDVLSECLRYVRGNGTQMQDPSATEEGRNLLAMVLDNLALAQGNSIYDLVTFSQYDAITQSDNGLWFTMTAPEMDDYVDQQFATDLEGHVELMEKYKALGLSNFNFTIDPADYANGEFIGGSTYTEVTDMFDALIRSSKASFRIASKKIGGRAPLILKVDEATFVGYEKWLLANYGSIDATFLYLLDGGGGVMSPADGVLRYKSIWVVRDDEWTKNDADLGITTYRLCLTAPKNFGVGVGVPGLNQFGGAGMVVQMSNQLQDKGKTFVYNKIELGATFIDKDLITHGSHVITP